MGLDPLKRRIAAELAAARARTLALADLPDADQRRQVSPLMSPIVWDLAHIGNYEELWLLRAVDGRPPIDEALDDLYNAFEHPRWERPSLPILGPADARAYVEGVRRDALAVLHTVDLDPPAGDAADPLRRDGFVYGMVIQHEHQHDETILATHQLMGDGATPPPGTSPNPPAAVPVDHDDVLLDGGPFTMGTAGERSSGEPGAGDLWTGNLWAYDNERPAHPVHAAPFRLDRHPVTNAQYARFVAAGGYDEPRWWSAPGWAWRQEAGLVHPQFWRFGGDGWEVQRFGTWRPVHPDEPVQHVCWYEADAYARWAGKRLPTEAEWEYAATWHPAGRKQRWPWGDADPSPAHANLGQRHAGPSPVGAYPQGANPWGVHQLIGDVWEWTATDFGGYPGFRSFPYKEYSEVFFGTEYKVLRGGSWAAHPVAVRGTFRNWDYPIRRQIFCGFRCAAAP